MSKTEMLRQLAAAKYNPPPTEEPPAPHPEPLPEPAPIEPPPASLPRPRKSQPPPPNPATSEQLEALRQQIGELIRQRQSDEQKTASLNELAELAGQMGASLAKLSEEYRGLLPRIMEEPKQQTAAMIQEVRAVLQEMKSALKETSHAAQDVQRAASRVNGLSLKTWLGQVGTCLIVSAALLLGFSIWRPQLTPEGIKQALADGIMDAGRQAREERRNQQPTELPKPPNDRSKHSGAKDTKLESKKEDSAPPKQPETSPPVEPVQWSTTNGAPPK